MRKLLTLGCCAVYVAFGFVAGTAHVHESADHHEQSGGLHLDHAHLDETADQVHEHHHGYGSAEEGAARLDARHVGHHDGDALYLSATALRSLDLNLRLMPATVSVAATTEPPSAASSRDETMPDRPRGPPRRSPTRPRAPPA